MSQMTHEILSVRITQNARTRYLIQIYIPSLETASPTGFPAAEKP